MAAPKTSARSAFFNAVIFLSFSAVLFCLTNLIFSYAALFREATQLRKAGEVLPPEHYSLKLGYLYTPSKLGLPLTMMLVCIISLLLTIKISDRKKRDPEAEGVKGTAKWATRSEILSEDKELKQVDIRHISASKNTGMPMYRSGYHYIVDTSTTHSLTVGATRAGKSQVLVNTFLYLLAQAQNKQNVVINDMKAELLEQTYSIFKDNGYNIKVLNLRDTSISSGYNPLAIIIDGYCEAMRTESQNLDSVINDIHSLSDAITYDKQADPIWPSSAKALLSAIILYLLEACYLSHSLDKLSMYTVTTFFIEYGTTVKDPMTGLESNKLDELFQELPTGHAAKTEYATSNFSTGDTRSSIYTTLSDDLSLWSDEGICRLTASREIDFNEIITSDTPTAVFMVIPDDRRNRHKLAILFVNQMYQSLISYITKNRIDKMPRRWNFVLDEFAQMPPIPDMAQKMNVSAGRNILFHLFVQSFSQLEGKYQKSADSIQQACGNLIYVYSNNTDTNKYISELLSNYTKSYRTYSGKADENSSQHIDGKPLMSPAELRRLKKGEIIIIRQRLNPIFARLKFFYTFAFRKTSIYDIPIERPKGMRVTYLLPDFSLLISTQKKHIAYMRAEKVKEQQNSSMKKKDLTLQDVFFYYEHERVARGGGKRSGKASSTARNSRRADERDRQELSPLSVSIAEANSLSEGEFSIFLDNNDFGSAKKIINRISLKDPAFKQQHSARLQEYIEARKSSM